MNRKKLKGFCQNCKHFYEEESEFMDADNNIYTHLRYCHAPKQMNDFSCFEGKDE